MLGSVSALLAVSHPPSFLDALILVAAFERPVHCLVDQRLLRGPMRRLFAAGLGMVTYHPEGENWQSVLDVCCNLLARGEVVLVFAEQERLKAGEAGPLGMTAATLALEAETRYSGQLGLTIFPVHLFLPVARSQAGELLIYVDDPIYPREYLVRDAPGSSGGARALAAIIWDAWRENAFRLQPNDVRQLLSSLEEVLRTDLEEDWAARPNWKQNVEGFELSQFVAEWSEQMNYLNPGRLVALHEALGDYREARRRWSLRQIELESGGEWVKSRPLRAWVWCESAIGLPIACYGLINHLLVWLLLFWFGLLKKQSERAPKVQWLLRALVVLGCYIIQILLCARWLSRAAAGFYTLSLPLAGAYLVRYHWLLRHRTRLALVAFRSPARAAKLRDMRKKLVAALNRAMSDYVETLGVAH